MLGGLSFWGSATNSFYYTDFFQQLFYRYSLDDGQVYKTNVVGPDIASFIIPVENKPNQFLASLGRDIVLIEWDGISSSFTIIDVAISTPNLIYSFVVGPNNEFYIGVYGDGLCLHPPTNPLYQYTTDRGLIIVADGFVSTVALAIDETKNIFYQLLPCNRTILGYDYNPSDGSLCKLSLWN